jgi:miniconductance mechanosensitive channel
MYKNLSNSITRYLAENLGMSHDGAVYLKTAIMLALLFVVCWLVWFFGRQLMLAFIHKAAKRTKTRFDDALVHERVFAQAAHIIPALLVDYTTPLIFAEWPETLKVVYVLTDLFIAWVLLRVVLFFFNALRYFLEEKESLRDKPIASYIQLAKIVSWIIGSIIFLSIAFDQSPVYFLSAMGAMTAVLLLIFKDTILGFVGSIQLAANDMVRIGDWVTMEKYGADGDVIEINLTTIKVKNFDHTITTIPTYSFISDSFRNWRGMQESAGRRIRRSVRVKADTIRFVDDALRNELMKIQLVAPYIEERQALIEKHNRESGADTSMPVNGRRMTNIGVFRRYIEAYLKNNPNINHELTCMVRQLEATENGVPLEVYCFSSVKEWVPYETIVGDLFDHILTAARYFDLELYENPAASDMRAAFGGKA